MTYRPILTPQPSPESEIDTPEMTEAATFIDGADADLQMLSELAQIGMRLARAQGDYACGRLESVAADDAASLKPGEDPAGGFNKIAQTVRRIVALKRRVAEDVEQRRVGLVRDRSTRRGRRASEHATAVGNAIDSALTDAFTVMYGDGDAETTEGDDCCAEMLADKEDLLGDLDVFKDYLDRPVGETVARLCAELGLPADACVRSGDGWLVKRVPSTYERFRESRAGLAPPS